jgi:hypothetical protein
MRAKGFDMIGAKLAMESRRIYEQMLWRSPLGDKLGCPLQYTGAYGLVCF